MRRGGLVKECDWTEAEVVQLRATYADAPPLRLAALAESLGRNKANVCRKARGLGLTDPMRPKVAERKPPPAARFQACAPVRSRCCDPELGAREEQGGTRMLISIARAMVAA